MNIYKKPVIVSYPTEKILELLGPGHSNSANITVEIWRGAIGKSDKEKPAEYRMAKASNIRPIFQLKEEIC